MKRNKGITLIVLAITIIVLIIIAWVGTYSGISALRSSKENAQLSEVRMVQQAVVENYTKYKTTENDMYIRGTAVSYEDVNGLLAEMGETPKTIEYTISNPSEKSPYYYYRLSETDLKDMDISQAEGDTFIVNYATGGYVPGGYNSSTWKHTGTNSNIIEMRSGDTGYITTNYAQVVAIDTLGNVGPVYTVAISVGEPLKETDTPPKDYTE